MIADLLAKHGYTSKLVRAYCKAMGWRHTPNGAPAEWYAAWPEIACVLAGTAPTPRT